MKKVQGSISVFLALTITLILSFCIVLIESAREQTLLLKADVVFGACINSALAEYHQGLWETYDVLYVDASYKTGIPNYAFIQNRFRYYAKENLKYDGDGWLSLAYMGSVLEDISLATDNYGESFYQKAIESVKFEKGVTILEEVVSYIETLEGLEKLSGDLEREKESITTQIEKANGSEIEWEGEIVTIEVENPLQEIETGNMLVRKVVGESVALSQKRIEVAGTVSKRNLAKGTVERVTEERDLEQVIDTILDKAWYVDYVGTHFQNYLHLQEEKTLDYELEYLIAGKGTDIQNLEAVVTRLLFVREADNYLSLLSNEAKKMEAHTIAAATANIAIWLEPVVYQAVLIFWAYEMSVADLQLLFTGGKVPLCKSLDDNLSSKLVFGYEEYLYMLLLLEQREKLTMRSLDLVELYIRREEEEFHMDGCVNFATYEGKFEDTQKKQYTITKTMEYY